MQRFIPLVTVAVLLAACGEDLPPVTAQTYEWFRAQPTACGATAPPAAREMQFDGPNDMRLRGDVEVTLRTSCGPIVIEVVPAIAPQTANSFVFLADRGYFDGTVFHRVLPGFVIQGGDPTASGTGGPGYRLPDELPPPTFTYAPGVVAMANAGPNTSGSQFFIVVGETALPPAYSVFGRIVDGLDTLIAIVGVPIDWNWSNTEPSRPTETIYIESVEISGR